MFISTLVVFWLLVVVNRSPLVDSYLFTPECVQLRDIQADDRLKVMAIGAYQFGFITVASVQRESKTEDISLWHVWHQTPIWWTFDELGNTVALSNHSMVPEVWPRLSHNVSNEKMIDAAIIAYLNQDFLVFRQQVKGERFFTYQSLHNHENVHYSIPHRLLPEADDYQFVSSPDRVKTYGIQRQAPNGTKKLCLVRLERTEPAAIITDFRVRPRSHICYAGMFEPVHRAWLNEKGDHLYAIMKNYPNVSVYRVTDRELIEVDNKRIDEFFFCTMWPIFILVLILAMCAVVAMVVVHYFQVSKQDAEYIDKLAVEVAKAMQGGKQQQPPPPPHKSPKSSDDSKSTKSSSTSSSTQAN